MTRAWLDDNGDGGWPQALNDPQITAVLDALHATG